MILLLFADNWDSHHLVYFIRLAVCYYYMTMNVIHVTPLDSRIYNGYRERYLPLHIIDVNCTGEEATIWDCPHNAVVENSNCRSYYQDAAVTCLGKTYSLCTMFCAGINCQVH